ncbi:hypothetical protein TrCOL_g6581 [Triparma columacea]|nr:hypothetical protein TrCOL_g6581 [Triparma columacea]
MAPLSRAESEAVFSRVEYVSVESGRYYNSYRDSNGGMTPPKISIADSGYVVYEILVRANFDNAMAWTCHRRYKNFLELEESLPPPSSVELSGCVWDDEEDEEFDYKKGVRTNTIAEEGEKKKGKNTYPPRPTLPPKKLMGNFKSKLIESRRIALNKYLRYLFLNPYTRSCEAFLSFIAAERLINSLQMSGGLTASAGCTFFTSKDSNKSAVGFVPTPSPAKNQKQMGEETLTSFPYAFRSTNGAGALGGWGEKIEGFGSERKKKKNKASRRKDQDNGGSLCNIL